MIIQNISASTNQGALPVRLISNDQPVAMPDTSAQLVSRQQPSLEQVKTAVDNINKTMQESNQRVEFSIDPNSKTPVVKMIDTETGKLIRQFPSEEVLAIAQSIDQYLNQHQLQQGLLLKQTA
jgi:flagellar protein FlaG